MIILMMGVSGSGKTTIGKMLAETLHWQFSDADDFHPAANVEKMSRGVPLSDADRLPWLQAMQGAIDQWLSQGVNVVLACSALKSEYRRWLQPSNQLQLSNQLKWVYLKGSFDLIQQRLNQRQGHYMKADLLQSQFDALEKPENALEVDISQPTGAIVQKIRSCLAV